MKSLFLSLLLFAHTPPPPPSFVYVCTGASSTRYHKTADCRGLNSCSGDIRKVSITQAIEMGRTRCRICKP